MRKLVILLGALAIGWVTPVEAAGAPVVPLGNQFCVGLTTPSQLADIAADALAKDPTGLTMLDPVRCNRPKPARPVDYLEMFKIDDPGAGLTDVRQLPDYLRSLMVQAAPQTKYWLACLKPNPRSTSRWSAVHNCISRAPEPGETVWVNPKTGHGVLNSKCTNPRGEEEHVENCGHIYVTVTALEKAIRLQESGPKPVEGQCVGVKRPGATDYENPYIDECPEALCNFRDVNNVLEPLGFKAQRRGSLIVDVTGSSKFDFLVPLAATEKDSMYVFTFCTERWKGLAPVPPEYPALDSSQEAWAQYSLEREEYIGQRETWKLTHSCGTVVKWVDYVSKNGTKVATLYYDQATARQAGTTKTDGQPTDLYWYWQDERDRCVAR